ncbi:MAG: DUF115 domain-containing protein [Bacteroidaceae bacterium]|nr:DUF115 domain-containing protein [Bacteroidaceae bacterium]
MGKAWLKTWNAFNFLYGMLRIGSRRRLRALKNVHSGERCFIIGNGPSLTNEDLIRLMKRGEYTFACNSLIKLFNEIPFRPTYYFAQDNKIILDNKSEIEAYNGTCFIKSHYARRYHIKGATYYNMLFPQPIKFSTQIPHVVYSGQTVTYSMMQFAAYMGFKEIYLIGVDCNYSAGNSVITAESYFNPKLFNSSRSYAAPEIDTNLLAYACARKVCDKLGIKVYNATRGGKLELFERANLDAVLGK